MKTQIDAKRKLTMFFKGLLVITIFLLCGALVALTQTRRLTRGDALTASLRGKPTSKRPQNTDLPKQQNILPSRAGQEEFQNDLARIEDFRRAKNLDGLIMTADELEGKWSRLDKELYGRLMLSISNIIANGFSDERIYRLSQKYASAALTKADSFSLKLETRLLEFLTMNLASVHTTEIGNSEWVKERSTKAKLWLHAWQRLEKSIDRNFNFSDVPSLNVCPPEETRMPCGIAPEGIKDPKLRAQYQTAINANTEKAREFNRQFMLRQISEYFPQEAEKYLINAYAEPPYNLEELKKYLDDYLISAGPKKKIVDEVKKKMVQ